MAKAPLFRITFINHDKVYVLYAKKVTQGDLFGFVDVIDPVFGENSSLLVDPAEEKLKTEFEGVNRFHLPIQSVIRIDEVQKQGTAKIKGIDASSTKVTSLPLNRT